MSGDGADPLTQALTWIEHVGKPMRADVEGIKRSIWWASGGCMGMGMILGLFMPTILKKLGFG